MLNEERVRHMTQMAMFEEKEGRVYQLALEYNRKDYVSLMSVVHFLIGTLFYWACYAAIAFFLLSVMVSDTHIVMIILGVVAGVLLYAFYIYSHMVRVRREAGRRYDQGLEKLNHLRKDYRILEKMYQKEEQLKEPEGWD